MKTIAFIFYLFSPCLIQHFFYRSTEHIVAQIRKLKYSKSQKTLRTLSPIKKEMRPLYYKKILAKQIRLSSKNFFFVVHHISRKMKGRINLSTNISLVYLILLYYLYQYFYIFTIIDKTPLLVFS